MTGLDRSGFHDFDALTGLVRQTLDLLDHVIDAGRLPSGGADYLASATLPHLEGARAGFRGWLRSDMARLAELRFLILRGGAVPADDALSPAERRAAIVESMNEARRRGPAGDVHRADVAGLVALTHARLVLAFLPRVPDEHVRYPAGRRTYADIPIPHGPAELAARLEELERQLWRTATGRRPATTDPAFRRTYGFFDAAERLNRRAFGLD